MLSVGILSLLESFVKESRLHTVLRLQQSQAFFLQRQIINCQRPVLSLDIEKQLPL